MDWEFGPGIVKERARRQAETTTVLYRLSLDEDACSCQVVLEDRRTLGDRLVGICSGGGNRQQVFGEERSVSVSVLKSLKALKRQSDKRRVSSDGEG